MNKLILAFIEYGSIGFIGLSISIILNHILMNHQGSDDCVLSLLMLAIAGGINYIKECGVFKSYKENVC